jgi:hypothetical protein
LQIEAMKLFLATLPFGGLYLVFPALDADDENVTFIYRTVHPPSPKQKVILLNGGDGSYGLLFELLQSKQHYIPCDHSIDQ